MVERIRPSVVWIGVVGSDFTSSGSGVIFDVDSSATTALVLTNYHVIEGGRQILVLVNETSTYTAVTVGADTLRDLAVLRICCSVDFLAASFGDASNLSLGTEVVAIGYPLSLGSELLAPTGGPTITRGVVSAIRDASTIIDD
ncbi:MAG: trypsin-like peptidase domain-containing protein, partial [Chloroflexi bacterium]|nr:trypsin-like peptidase domain-containing protein [Chloroflexota bacterium]